MSKQILASDIGGTFTDFVFRDDDGQLSCHKVSTNQTHPEQPVRALYQQQNPDRIHHGTTIATNAILEREGAEVMFLVTEGFQDLLTIGRQDRPGLYDFREVRPDPLVSSDQVLEVKERIGPDGTVEQSLSEEEVQRIVDRIQQRNPEAVAICLLHAYRNPRHEQVLREAIAPVTGSVHLSSDVLPEFREYERASTTVMNAYVHPEVESYVNRLPESGSSLSLMRSTGGLGTAEAVMERAVDLILSGPAGGTIAAASLANKKKRENAIHLDMGGTSTDVSMMIDGHPVWNTRMKIGGLPVGLPYLDIETIGAGGGSVVHMDEGGALEVGPESAGAEPGPVCYGRGGEQLTVTDAHVMAGHIGPDRKLAGNVSLAISETVDAFRAFCRKHGMEEKELVQGIRAVVNAKMARAIRTLVSRHGKDPEEFCLVAFGGAGPLHACELAGRLGIDQVLIPPHPGVFSATGIFQADHTAERSRSVLRAMDDVHASQVQTVREEMKHEIQQALSGVQGEITYSTSVDLRYSGQSYEITVSWGETCVERFHEAHEQHYGFRRDDRDVELVNVRMEGRITGTSLAFSSSSSSSENTCKEREPRLEDGNEAIRVYQRNGLGIGQKIQGEALVEEMSSTIKIPKGWKSVVKEDGTMICET